MSEKGVMYEGEWAYGKQHGLGKLYSTQDLSELVSGCWEMGQFQHPIKAD